MAVQDGYGKSSGSESLVFAYDLKDTVNSYRGEPTINYITTMAANIGGNVSLSYPNNVYICTAQETNVIDTTAPGGQYSRFTGNTDSDNNQLFTSFVDGGVNARNTTVSYSVFLKGTGTCHLTVYSDIAGYSTTPTITLNSEWTRYSIVQFVGNYTTHSWAAVRGVLTSTNVYVAAQQIEFNTHVTPFINGTRSSTQGLLDLTGNNIINVSAVSYDSNASIVFDGTDDYILLPSSYTTFVNRPRREITVNMILKFYNFNGQQEIMRTNGAMEFDVGEIGGSGSGRMSFWIYDGGWLSTDYDVMTNVGTNVWFMVTGVYSNVTNRHELYINGNLVTTGGVGGGTGLDLGGSGSTFIGAESTGALHFNGEIKVCQIYNKPLSSIEITNNYLKYKRQYGLT